MRANYSESYIRSNAVVTVVSITTEKTIKTERILNPD